MANPIQLTPEEIAEYEKSVPAAINPLRDFSADELFDLSLKDKENFDLVGEFRRNKDLWKDPTTVQKVAEVHSRIKDRGFEIEDIPGPGKIARTVFDIAKGFGKQAWNYANALVGVPIASAIGEITGDASQPGFTRELAQEGQRRVVENLAGTEAAAFGVARLAEKGLGKARRAFTDQTPEEKLSDLWKDVGTGETEEEILKGKGGLLEPVGGAVRAELEAAGKPVRIEETSALAAGDPLSFYTFGKIFQGAGKLIPAKVSAGVEKAATVAGKAAEVAGGRAIQAAGALTELGGRAVKISAPAVGLIKGAIEAGPLGALAGLKGGEIVSKIGGKLSKGGKAIAESGKEIAGATPVTGGVTQLAKDVIGGTPVAATEIGKGLAFDIGTAALTSESPRDTESVGIGAFFGGLGAARRVGSRVISGQLVGPRAWGSDQTTPSSGQHPMLDTMHAEAVKDATPAVKTRLNAIRQFLKGSHADTDVFLAKDAQAVENAMLQTGASPEQARQFSQTEGFFLTSLPDAQGNPRRVIIARNVDAAPHESFHAIQDVLGETANQHIDQIVREEYGPTWEQEGQRYAARIGPGEWREVVLDSTGTGLNYAKEKIAMDVANEYRASTGAEPPSGFVQDRVKAILGQVMDRAVQANPDVTPNDIARHAWRDILSPQEATAVADSYLARELAAENFDMVFKRGGGESGLTGRLARIVAQLVSTLGGEPLSPERPSQIGEIAPRFRVTEAVREAPDLVQPRETKPEILPTTPREPLPTTPPTQPPPADEARKIASEAPETSTTAGTASPREILGNVAEAIAQQSGLKVNYLSAPGEGPAASISSNRDARRAVIEAFRTMPPEARALWEKNFFPDRVVKLKGDKYQILGWAPEVFAANAHKLAAKLQELGVADASPYPVKAGTFTPEGWQELFKDVQTFVKNQMGGRTGAGESLVVPRSLTERGFFAPPVRGRAEALPQLKADFINMLFGLKIPDTARVQKGKIPLNLAGQVVSEATQPGRTEIPVIPRGRFEGAEAERQGIAGQSIKEVNPLRQQIEAAAQAKGVAMPEFIEAQQRLNLENIKDVQVAPELPQFRANTLTLSAGFQPSAEARAVKSAAVKDERGKVWEGFWHGNAEDAARTAGARGPFADGFTTNNGEFLTREDAFTRAKELKQISEDVKPGAFGVIKSGLETSQLPKDVLDAAVDKARFQPPKNAEQAEELVKSVAKMTPSEFEKWAHDTPGGLTEAAYQTGLNAATQGFVNLLKAAGDSFGKKAESLVATDVEAAMVVATQQQFFNEAWQAATGEGSAGFSLRKKNPNFQPKFPLDRAVTTEDTVAQMQPEKDKSYHRVLKEMSIQSSMRKEYREAADFLDNGFTKEEWDALPYANQKLVHSIAQFKRDWASPFGSNKNDRERRHPFNKRAAMSMFDDIPDFESRDTSFKGTRESAEAGEIPPVQMQPKKELKLKPAGRDGVSKAWVLPDGKVVNIGGQWHHDYLNENPALRKQYKLSDDTSQDNRMGALQKGFARLNWSYGSGNLTIEARTKDWPKQREAIRSFIEANADKIDRMQVVLLSDNLKKVDDANEVSVFTMEDNEKAAALPFGDLGDKRATGQASERLFEKAASKSQLQPTAVKDVAEDYAKKAGIEYRPSAERSNVPLDTAQKIADFYETAKHSPDASEVKESYAALAKETIAQYEAMKDAGYEIEPWTLEGEPYASSAEMVKDVTENKHLYFRRTGDSFGGSEADRHRSNPMLEQSGVDDLLVNDVFRAVHDFFGHAKEGLQFGPKGEFNAWKVHSEMYSPEAQGALAAETLAQNFWVNYGKHLRRKDGSVPAKGDEDFIALPDRPFAEQKNIIIPEELLNEVRAQFQPQEETRRRPGGYPVLGPEPTYRDIIKKMNIKSDTLRPHFEAAADLLDSGITEFTRKEWTELPVEQQRAIKELARFDIPFRVQKIPVKPTKIRGEHRRGNELTYRETVEQMGVYPDSMRLHFEAAADLLDTGVTEFTIKQWGELPREQQKAIHEIARFEINFPYPKNKSSDEYKMINLAKKLEAQESAQFQPKRGDKDLFGFEEKLSIREIAKLPPERLREIYPEAIVPDRVNESIPSAILESPLYEKSGSEDAAVKAFSDGLVKFAQTVRQDPVAKAGAEWYTKFTPELKKEFGKDAQLMAELLAATSPNTGVETNFKFALDALDSFKSGRFTKIMSKFNQGMDMVANDTWRSWYNKELKNIPEPPQKPTAATFLEHWIYKHDLKPRQSNGKLYGIHSLPVLQVFARKWLSAARGPKTLNFIENLMGQSHEATIDVWADRTMRRLGYADQERWRILPKNGAPVSEPDFQFAQKAFRHAADRLGMKPSALQGMLWFAEKKYWAEHGWADLNLGDFRTEMKKIPDIRAQRLTLTEKSGKIPSKQLDLK